MTVISVLALPMQSKELLLKEMGGATLASQDYDLSSDLTSGRKGLLEQKVKH